MYVYIYYLLCVIEDLCMYVYTHVCIHVCMLVSVFYVCMNNIPTYVCIYVGMYDRIGVCIYVCTICMHPCMDASMYL